METSSITRRSSNDTETRGIATKSKDFRYFTEDDEPDDSGDFYDFSEGVFGFRDDPMVPYPLEDQRRDQEIRRKALLENLAVGLPPLEGNRSMQDDSCEAEVVGVSQKNTEEPAKEVGAFEDVVGAAAFAEGAESENTMVDE